MSAIPPPSPRRRRWPLVIAAVLLVLVAEGVGLAWLAATEPGFAVACRLAATLSGGRLSLTPAGGRLVGPLQLREAAWHNAGLTIRIEDAGLDWSPAALLSGRLEIAHLGMAILHVDLPPPSGQPPALPASLRLPLAVDIGEIAIGRIEKGASLVAENVSAGLHSDGVTHRLTRLQGRAGRVSLDGDAELAGDPPFNLRARADLDGRWREHPFTLDLQAAGPLARFALSGRGGGAVEGYLAAVLTPFAAQPFERLQVHLSGIDPAAWVAGTPTARLDVDAELLPRPASTLAAGGRFVVANRAPGRIDAHRLPLHRLGGRVDWQGGTAVFSGLAASLAGGGSLAGEGRLADRTLILKLAARQLDAAALHGRLRPTRLAGPLSLQIGAEAQTLAADLADRRFRLSTRLARRGDQVDVTNLLLTAGQAALQASGRLSLGAAYRFEAVGELVRFDPSRFARLPAAQLNARFSAAGSLQPHPAVGLKFELHDSRFNGQPLAGRGDIDLDWPQVRRADLHLAGGPNRLDARGAFGRPGDRLAIDIDAPQLMPYGIEGGVRGQLQLGGTPAVPTLRGSLQAALLGLAGVGRLHGLQLQADAGSRPGDPLHLDLRLAALDTPSRAGAARDLTVQVDGSRARHTLRAGAVLAGERRLAVLAAGGLAERAAAMLWRGELRELALTPPDEKERLRLLQPAALRLGAAEWALGPAELAWSEWRGRLQGSAADGRLQAEASGRGERLGAIEARFEARLQGAWKLAPEAPWQGRLTLNGADVAWLGPLLGEDWQTAGRLQGELRLAGTPARPLVTGQLGGDQLGLRIASQGLQLERGRLAADLAGNRLRLTTLAFDSALRPLPHPLALAAGRELAGLAATPGRLEMSGELGLGPLGRISGAESGFVDIRLERVGLFQQSDQWLAASGDARLRWQGGVLGAVGRVAIDAGWWELARPGIPKLSDDVVIRSARQETGKLPATRPRLELDLTADLGRHFHFLGVGLESRLAGSVRLRSAGRDLPRASGSIHTVGGRFDAYGQKLSIERGILNFQDFVDNPSLNVRAVRQGLPVEAGVEVGGTVKKPVVRLVSDPELPDAEKLSWLVLGHGAEQTGGNDASVLLAAAGSILGKDSGGVVQQLQRRFGIEEFGLRQGSLGDTGSRQATSRVAASGGFSGSTTTGEQIVTVGKRLSSNAVLSYEQALGRTENVVKLTVNLSRRLSVVGRAGSDNAIDLFYTFSFGR